MKNEKNKIIKSLIPILERLREIYIGTNDENIKKSIKKMTRTLIGVSLENVPADYVSNDAWREIKNYKELKKIPYHGVCVEKVYIMIFLRS